jgi:hypothetical protein
VERNLRGERNSEKALDAAAASEPACVDKLSLGINGRERESVGSLKVTRVRSEITQLDPTNPVVIGRAPIYNSTLARTLNRSSTNQLRQMFGEI